MSNVAFQPMRRITSPKLKRIINSPSNWMYISSPRGCGKNITVNTYLIDLADRNPGIQIIIYRQTYAEFEENIFQQQNTKILDTLTSQPFKWRGGLSQTRSLDFDNGSKIFYRGLDKEGEGKGGSGLGSEHDVMWIDQVEKITDQRKIADIAAGMPRGRRWKHKGKYHWRVILTANPGSKYHWAYKRAIDPTDSMEWVALQHLDNPLYRTKDGGIDEVGQGYVDSITETYRYDRVAYERMVLGIHNVSEGIVYPQFQEDRHIIPMQRDQFDAGTSWHWAVDFGATSPHSALLIGKKPNGEHWIYKELYHTEWTVPTLIQEMRSIEQDNSIVIESVVPDPANRIHDQLTEAGYWCNVPEKDIISGVALVQRAFASDSIYINVDSLVNPDNNPSLASKPKRLVEELGTYSYKDPSQMRGGPTDDKPVDIDNHACDALRYYCEIMASFTRYEGPLFSVI